MAIDPSSTERSPAAHETLPRAFGRYVLLKRIARGGMGEVLLASTTGVEGAERPVVVKVIRRDHATDPSFIARFLDEARVQAQLQHSGVAQVIEAAIDPESGEPYAVVEYVEGKSLGDVRARALQTGKQLGWPEAVSVVTLIAEALAHVHERQDAAGQALGIVHRDLSPQNVMIGYAGEAKIIDFGTARGQNRRCHTVSGVVFAKPGYVAPEVANGDSGDAKVDVYALGVMLWELVAGRRFLQGDASVHMAQVARNAKSPPALAATASAPAELDPIIARMMAFDRAERPTARMAAQDLAKLLAQAQPLEGGERSIRARTAELMTMLFPNEPGASRREFHTLGAAAQNQHGRREPTPQTVAKQTAPTPRAKPVVDLLPGQVLPGTRWRIKGEIGRGASSVVYEAEHMDLGRSVALKLLDAQASRATDFAERFRHEARALSRLRHENLIGVVDVGVSADGRLFCVMDLLEGETLESYIGREKGFDWREALAIADQALAALEVAHGANLVHRDIKPANMFLVRQADGSARGRPFGVKLLDFGLAKPTGEGASNTAPPKGFALFGTVEYMAPEQAGGGSVDARADLYALGCVLYEMLTGTLPFTGAGSMAILDAKMNGSPERLRSRAPDRGIPAGVDALVLRAISRHATARFQTATAMRRALADARAPQSVRRAARSLVAFASATAVVTFAAFAVGGRLPLLRHADRVLTHAVVTPAAIAALDDADGAAAFDPSAGVTDPTDSWAMAERGEDAPEPAAEEVAPAATEEAAPPPPSEPAPKSRAHPRKRKGDSGKAKLAKAPPAPKKDSRKAAEPSIDDEPAPSLDEDKAAKLKSRRKKKSRMAHVE